MVGVAIYDKVSSNYIRQVDWRRARRNSRAVPGRDKNFPYARYEQFKDARKDVEVNV